MYRTRSCITLLIAILSYTFYDLYTRLLTKDTVYMHSYIIFAAIIALLVTNHYLDKSQSYK